MKKEAGIVLACLTFVGIGASEQPMTNKIKRAFNLKETANRMKDTMSSWKDLKVRQLYASADEFGSMAAKVADVDLKKQFSDVAQELRRIAQSLKEPSARPIEEEKGIASTMAAVEAKVREIAELAGIQLPKTSHNPEYKKV